MTHEGATCGECRHFFGDYDIPLYNCSCGPEYICWDIIDYCGNSNANPVSLRQPEANEYNLFVLEKGFNNPACPAFERKEETTHVRNG